MKNEERTLFALSTKKAKSALAVFRISGKNSHKVIKSLSSRKKFKTNVASLNSIYDGKNRIDQTITTFFKEPNSYTGEDMVEISCHGSISVINKITEVILKKNIRMAEPGEFTKKALLNNKLTIIEAETVNDLINAETENQRKIAIENLTGNLDKFVKNTSKNISKLLADVEAIIDFADEDLPKKIYMQIKEQKKNICTSIEEVIQRSSISKKIFDGFKITIIGKPNTGKSSFINYINNKEVSIVTSIPGTTTDLVTSVLEINGDKYTFVDTAGIRKYKNIIEKIGIQKSLESAENSDINLVFLKKDEKEKYKDIKSKIFVKSKFDKNNDKISGIHNISSISGHGIEKLLNKISRKLKNKPVYGSVFSRERHIESLKKALYLIKLVKFQEIDIDAENIKRALMHINGINQTFDIEKILDIIFADFCIGK